MTVSFTLNGKAVNFDGDPETPILWILRVQSMAVVQDFVVHAPFI
jgi:aerobic-type carbon monoxide dehydrogenase small subunit (CoxS/CutS family)